MKKKLNFWLILADFGCNCFYCCCICFFNRPAGKEFPAYFYIHGRDEDFYAWATQIAKMTDPVARSTQQAVFAEFSVLATNSLSLAKTQQAMGCFDNFEAPGCVELNPTVAYGIREDMGMDKCHRT